MNEISKVAITGTFLTGKSTICEALKNLTNIPIIKTTSIELILQQHSSCKTLWECSPCEYFKVCLLNFKEQMLKVNQKSQSFWSEDTLISNYAYGLIKTTIGYSYTNQLSNIMKRITMMPYNKALIKCYEAFGEVIKMYMLETYNSIIHLPVEFEYGNSTAYPDFRKTRKMCDELMIQILEDMGIRHYIITGDIKDRLEKIIKIYDLKPVVNIETAIEKSGCGFINSQHPISQDRKTYELS